MLPWPLIEIELMLPAFCVVLCRVSGVMLTAPLYGSSTIPARLKIAFILAISVAVFPVLIPILPSGLTMPVVVGGLVGELMIGLVIGVGFSIILLAIQMAGLIIGQQAGLALANVFDPNTESQTSVIGTIYFWTATMVFLALGGHRGVLGSVLESFQTVPAMSFKVNADVVNLFAELMMMSVIMAVRIAGPMVVALLIAKGTLGFLSRTMPQLHILSVGFAIFVSLGMLLSGLTIENLFEVLFDELAETFEMIRALFGLG